MKPIDLTDSENLFDVVTAIHKRLDALERVVSFQHAVLVRVIGILRELAGAKRG